MDTINNFPRDVLNLILTSSFEVARAAYPVCRRWRQITFNLIAFRPFSQKEITHFLDLYPTSFATFVPNNYDIIVYQYAPYHLEPGYKYSDILIDIYKQSQGEICVFCRDLSDKTYSNRSIVDRIGNHQLDLLTQWRILSNRPSSVESLIRNYLHSSFDEICSSFENQIDENRSLGFTSYEENVPTFKLLFYLSGYLFVNASLLGLWPLNRKLYTNRCESNWYLKDEGAIRESIDKYRENNNKLKIRIHQAIDRLRRLIEYQFSRYHPFDH